MYLIKHQVAEAVNQITMHHGYKKVATALEESDSDSDSTITLV